MCQLRPELCYNEWKPFLKEGALLFERY
jgi:hypothetical protein